jgi:exonuclease III
MRFGTWNVRSLYRSGTLMMVVGELARYKLDLVGVQEVRRDKAGTIRAGDYTLFYGGRTCCTYGGEERCIQDYSGEI